MSPIADAIAPLTRQTLAGAGQSITRAGLRDQLSRLLRPSLIEAAIDELVDAGQIAAERFGQHAQQVTLRLPDDAPQPPKQTLPEPRIAPITILPPAPLPAPPLRCPAPTRKRPSVATRIHKAGLAPPPELRIKIAHSAVLIARKKLHAASQRRQRPAKVRHAPVRATVLVALETAPATRQQLHDLLQIGLGAVSSHLKWLKTEGLIVRYGTTRSPSGQAMTVWVGAERRLFLPMPTEARLTPEEQLTLDREPESQ